MTIDDIELTARPTGVAAPSADPVEVGQLPETLFHDRRWQRAVEQSFGLAIKEFVPKAEPTGRGYYSVVSDIRGERVICTPFSDFCDPLMGEAGWAEFTDHLRSYGVPVTVRPFRNQAVIGDTSFQRRSELLWHGIELDDGFDPFWDSLKSKLRTKVRRSRKEMTFRASSSWADIELFHAMHVDLRKSKYGLLAQPLEFFANLHESFGDDMVVLLADYDGDPVAGMVYFECNGVWYYKFGASLPCDRRPNDALLVEACRIGAERGLELVDLGRSDIDQPGLVQFKEQFATDKVPLTTLHWEPAGYNNVRGESVGATLGALTSLLTAPDVPNEIAAQGGELLYKFFS